jgi:hypothetical protein
VGVLSCRTRPMKARDGIHHALGRSTSQLAKVEGAGSVMALLKVVKCVR